MEIGKISSQRQQSMPSSVHSGMRHVEEADTSFSAELTDQRGNMTREELEALLGRDRCSTDRFPR